MSNPAHSEEQRIGHEGESIYQEPVWMSDTVRELARQLPDATDDREEADLLVSLSETIAKENGEDFVEIAHIHEAITRLHQDHRDHAVEDSSANLSPKITDDQATHA